MRLTFVEAEVFSKRIKRLGLDADLRSLQLELLQEPELGDLDPGTGGLRKVRMTAVARGKGKRSGARVHYLFLPDVSRIYLMFVYAKDEMATLTKAQKKQLRAVVQAIKTEAR